MCGPHRRFAPLLPRTLRRIPQAVSTVATHPNLVLLSNGTLSGFNTASGKHCCNDAILSSNLLILLNVSIPQAVSTVATAMDNVKVYSMEDGFNTASGKHCCNELYNVTLAFKEKVSIPQAVSTVATYQNACM